MSVSLQNKIQLLATLLFITSDFLFQHRCNECYNNKVVVAYENSLGSLQFAIVAI